MQASDLFLLRARWVLPIEPAGVVLSDHSVVIQGDRILDILPSAVAPTHYPSAVVVPLEDHVLIPGLVNAHTHAAMTLLRGLSDDLPLMTWLTEHIWPAEARFVGPEFVRDGTTLAAAEMLLSGTTCFNDMYFFPEEAAEAAVATGIRASIGLIVLDLGTRWARNAKEYLERATVMHERLANRPLIRTTLAPHAPYTVSDTALLQVRELAAEWDVPIHMHVHETATEVTQSLATHNERPLARLQRLGLLSSRLLAVHMTQLTPAEIVLCARSGVQVVHCPESNLKLASGFCPVMRLRAAGIKLAIGTDGAASNNDLDMLGELRTAALLAKAVSGDPRTLSADDALRLATLGGAEALGMGREIGSIVPGKAADLVAVNLAHVATTPVYRAVSALVYAANRSAVSDVWVAGQRVVQDGALTTMDITDVLARAHAWGERIAEKDGHNPHGSMK